MDRDDLQGDSEWELQKLKRSFGLRRSFGQEWSKITKEANTLDISKNSI